MESMRRLRLKGKGELGVVEILIKRMDGQEELQIKCESHREDF